VKSDRQRKHQIQESASAATLWLPQPPKIGAGVKEVATSAIFATKKPSLVGATQVCLVIHGSVKNIKVKTFSEWRKI